MTKECNNFMHGMWWIFLIAFILTTICFFLAISYMEELGQAICEGEYGMDFVSYSSNTLKCEPKEIQVYYDGIKVKIGGE